MDYEVDVLPDKILGLAVAERASPDDGSIFLGDNPRVGHGRQGSSNLRESSVIILHWNIVLQGISAIDLSSASTPSKRRIISAISDSVNRATMCDYDFALGNASLPLAVLGPLVAS
jgi:hypothetical protein